MTRVFALLIAFGIAAACAVPPSPATRSPANGALRTVKSNVRFEDYAGSNACARCHAAESAAWRASPMHNMTREAKLADIKGPFDGTAFHLRDDTATLESAGPDRFMTLRSKRFGNATYRVTRVIGGHHREDYAGVPVSSAFAGAPALGDPTEEYVLPVSFMLDSRSLRYKGYSVMVKERDGLKAGAVWNQTCIFCHNTVPFLSTALGALAGSGGYQGEVVDPLLPPSLRASYVVTDPSAMTRALEGEMSRLGARHAKPTLKDAIAVTRSRFRANHLVEVGIGCESCHLGAAEHVKDPMTRPSFEATSDAFTVRMPSGPANHPRKTRTEAVNRVCARCHQVLFSGYDPTWEGGSRKRAPGGSHINSGEARDMLLGACASELTCVGCHDPHAPDGTATLRALEPAKEDALCTKCHGTLASPDAQRAHSHHDPAGEGSRCLSCHMPRKNMALDGKLSRYHRIGSPTDVEKVLLDRPLECALCHADKTVAQLVSTMERWWNKSYERGGLERLYGSRDESVLLATAQRGKPHEQAVAFQLLGDSVAQRNAAEPVLMDQLTNPYPLVRGYAKRALETLRGGPIDVDIDAPDDVIRQQTKAMRDAPRPAARGSGATVVGPSK